MMWPLPCSRKPRPSYNLLVQHLKDEGLACAVRADHPAIGDAMTRKQFETMKHVNIVPPGRMRAGLFQALAQQQLKRDVAISVTNFFAAAEMVAVTDYCATLPSLICRQLMHDPRLKILPPRSTSAAFPWKWPGTSVTGTIPHTAGYGR